MKKIKKPDFIKIEGTVAGDLSKRIVSNYEVCYRLFGKYSGSIRDSGRDLIDLTNFRRLITRKIVNETYT